MIDRNLASDRQFYEVQLGHNRCRVVSDSGEHAIQEARRRFCQEMPRLWDLIRSLDSARFIVRQVG